MGVNFELEGAAKAPSHANTNLFGWDQTTRRLVPNGTCPRVKVVIGDRLIVLWTATRTKHKDQYTYLSFLSVVLDDF